MKPVAGPNRSKQNTQHINKMIRLLSDVRKLTKLSERAIGIHTTTLSYLEYVEKWNNTTNDIMKDTNARTSDFKNVLQITKIPELTVRIHNTTLTYLQSMEKQNQVILETLQKITKASERGHTQAYLLENDLFWVTPEVHYFFTNSGFRILTNAIDWSPEEKIQQLQ